MESALAASPYGWEHWDLSRCASSRYLQLSKKIKANKHHFLLINSNSEIVLIFKGLSAKPFEISLNPLESRNDFDVPPYEDTFLPYFFQMLFIFDWDCLWLLIFGWCVSPFSTSLIISDDLNYFARSLWISLSSKGTLISIFLLILGWNVTPDISDSDF